MLVKSDHILVFFTEKARKLDLADIVGNGAGEFNVIEVPAGKQSVDNHIISYLGYLAGKHEKSQIKVVIISKDTGYDNIVKFWNAECKIHVSRAANVQSAKTAPKKQSKTPASKPETPPKQPNSKTLLNNQIIQKLSQSGYSYDISSFVASTVVKNLGVKGGKQLSYRAIISKYKQAKGLEIYNQIKNLL